MKTCPFNTEGRSRTVSFLWLAMHAGEPRLDRAPDDRLANGRSTGPRSGGLTSSGRWRDGDASGVNAR
jgi:hypothetical protein